MSNDEPTNGPIKAGIPGLSDQQAEMFVQSMARSLPVAMAQAFSADLAEAFDALQHSWRTDSVGSRRLLAGWTDSLNQIQADVEESSQLSSRLEELTQINSNFLESLINEAPGLDIKHKSRLQFWRGHVMAMLDAKNWPMTNPEVWQRAIETEGESLVKGLRYLRDDAAEDPAGFHIKRCADKAFELGQDLAATKGKVVFQNRLIQVIHYSPVKKTVSAIPLLIVPPCINKYYVLDLTEELSLVRWLVDQRMDLYIISWVNPGSNEADLSLTDYIESGVDAAREFVLQHASSDQLHLAGYCIGGLLAALSCAGAGRCSGMEPYAESGPHADSVSDKSVASLTLLATLLDYRNPGELEVFLSERTVEALLEKVADEGYLHGNMLSWAFTLLRENQLFWPYLVSRYWLGEDLPEDPVMYWNQDVANLPAKMTGDYLTNFYVLNRFWQQEEMILDDQRFSLAQISAPTYLLACKTDHIVDWRTALGASTKLRGPVRRVLASGGHVMGVLNSPDRKKPGRYWSVNAQNSQDGREPDFKSAQSGSWWLDWFGWLDGIDNRQRNTSDYKFEQEGSIEPAPGEYVRRVS